MSVEPRSSRRIGKKTHRVGRVDFILKLMGIYKNEADKCGRARAYLAGCIILGTAIEAGLLAMVKLYPEQLKSSKTYQHMKELKKKEWRRKELPYHLVLDHLNKIAVELGWLTPEHGKIVDAVREIRNLVHPGRHVRLWKGVRISKRHYDSCYKVAEYVFSHLETRL